MTPAAGHVHSAFTVHFTAPAASGPGGGQTRFYHLTASPARRSTSGCIDAVSLTPQATSAGEAMAVRLSPRRLGGRWCAGRYSGEVTETIQPVCQPIVPPRQVACPEYIALVPVGHFSFRVRR